MLPFVNIATARVRASIDRGNRGRNSSIDRFGRIEYLAPTLTNRNV